MTARHPARVAALAGIVVALALLVPTPAVAGNDTLDASGSDLQPPLVPRTATFALPDLPCDLLLVSRDGTCGSIRDPGFDLLYTVDPGPPIDDVLVSRPWVVRVYAPGSGDDDEWQAVLETRPQGADAGPVYADVQTAVGDITGDGKSELLIGYRSEGTGQILDLDIVGTIDGGVPQVLAHEQLYKGTAKVKQGALVTWSPIYKKLEANCCPSWIRRDVVRFEDGAFVVHHGKKVPTAEAHIPRGDF